MRRLHSLVIAIALLAPGPTSVAIAADGWRATQVAGEVRVEMAGAPAVRLTIEMVITHDALIETAASGSATLTRGEDRIVVAPNSRLRLPAEDSSGLTRVIEQFGELFFQVSKRTQPHFRVETPLLAATVKGTAFTVAVGDRGTKVNVREGLVLVENSASTDSTYVAAGRSASVAAAEPLDLYLGRDLVPPAALRLGEGHARRLLASMDEAPVQPHRALGPKQRASEVANVAPLLPLATTPEYTRGPAASLVIDSTLSGIGVGIIAAALAIVVIGTSRRRPGLVAAKPKRAAAGDKAQG